MWIGYDHEMEPSPFTGSLTYIVPLDSDWVVQLESNWESLGLSKWLFSLLVISFILWADTQIIFVAIKWWKFNTPEIPNYIWELVP